MKYPNHTGRAVEIHGALFMVVPIDEVDPSVGDMVRLDVGTYTPKLQWFVVSEVTEDDNLTYYTIRPATFFEKLFGVRRVPSAYHTH